MFVCAVLDQAGQCQQWAVLQSVLPSLSVQEAATLGGAIIGVWGIAFGVVAIVRLILNRY